MAILRRVCIFCSTHYGCWIQNVCIFCDDCNQTDACEIPITMGLDSTGGVCRECFDNRKRRKDR